MASSFIAHPSLLKEFQDVEIIGDLAVVFAIGGLVINISDPAQPQLTTEHGAGAVVDVSLSSDG